MLIILIWLVAVVCVAGALLFIFSSWMAEHVERLVPPIGGFMDVDGARIHYLDVGSGPTIVLVHGLAGQMQHLTYDLVDRLNGRYRLVFVDRPGSGYSDRVPGVSARLPVQAATIATLMRSLKLDKPLLVGHSLGGAVALAIALDHPELVGGLALIAPLTHPQADPPKALAKLAIVSPTIRALVAKTLATPISIVSGHKTLAEIFAPDPVPRDFATRGAALLGLRPKTFFNASTDLVAVPDDLPTMVERYGTIDMPAGILFGTEDRILSPAVQGEPMRAKVAGLSVQLIAGQGHMLPITAADATATFIAEMAERARLRV